MLTSIFETLTEGLASVVNFILCWFTDNLQMSLSTYLDIFPIFNNVYHILQGAAVGLAAIVAAAGLIRFSTNSVQGAQADDRPAAIMVKTIMAVILIFMGGYILEFLVELAKIPYEQFAELSISFDSKDENSAGFMAAVTAGILVELTSGVFVASDLAVVLLEFFLVSMLLFNLFKLILEVCERYMMVGVLVFTSPLVYSTIPSKNTSDIFKRWCSMFFGSLIMMSMSVIFLKIIMNGLHNVNNGEHYILKILLILATCKIAQRIDSYLQQIGIGAATTGQSLLDDAIFFASTVGKFGHHGGGGGGEAGGNGRAPKTILGSGANAAWSSMVNEQGGVKQASKRAASAMKDRVPAVRAVAGFKEGQRAGESVGKSIRKGATELGKASVGNALNMMGVSGALKATEARDGEGYTKTQRANMAKGETDTSTESTSKSVDFTTQNEIKNGSTVSANKTTMPEALTSEIENGNYSPTAEQAIENYTKYGASNSDGQYCTADKTGNIKLTSEAVGAGLQLNNTDDASKCNMDSENREALVNSYADMVTRADEITKSDNAKYSKMAKATLDNTAQNLTPAESMMAFHQAQFNDDGRVPQEGQTGLNRLMENGLNAKIAPDKRWEVKDCYKTNLPDVTDETGTTYPSGSVINTSLQRDSVNYKLQIYDRAAYLQEKHLHGTEFSQITMADNSIGYIKKDVLPHDVYLNKKQPRKSNITAGSEFHTKDK